MGMLLNISSMIDALTRYVGRAIIWLILAATLISAANAVARKAFSVGSNAFLEIQWYLFAAVFMLGAGHAFLQNAHVRIDVLANKLSKRTRMYIDIGGILFFLLPMCYLISSFAWPVLMAAYTSGEVSSNAGGLIRWPLYALVPAGFALLALQGVSEVIKRAAFLSGAGPDPTLHETDAHDPLDTGHAHSAQPASGEVNK
ncbi:TRAP transporter small permease subunit [Pseudothauera lacus]|uniref:TRAP transporter small permease protein n=1 Tax=Pseudothauera lacus TaxID=2136175 RepID=A0A2T4IEE2_9RHOO|nr:TRAP transporter small permease subunit [Pseudothauera lacus]PTD96133.1 C4-dicarboxylate ABC transporter substrate-binding protein [Pseudothauera lacus]